MLNSCSTRTHLSKSIEMINSCSTRTTTLVYNTATVIFLSEILVISTEMNKSGDKTNLLF